MPEVRVTLPSGTFVRVAASGVDTPLADDHFRDRPTFSGRLLNAVAAGMLRIDGPERFDVERILELPLRDYHALRDVAERLGIIAAEPAELSCRNCDAPLDADPIEAPRDDLETWYEGDRPAPAEPLPLGRTLPLGGKRVATTVSLAPRTLRQALPLYRALASSEAFAVTPSLVTALGITALGEETEPRRIARVLARAPEELWLLLEAAFLRVNHADHASFPVVCPTCGAVHDVPAPSLAEFDPDPDIERRLWAEGGSMEPSGEFPSPELFDAMVERLGEEVYRERAVRNIALVVDDGIPPVDGSGEPLLGSYEPRYDGDGAGYTTVAFVITLYRRTFERMWEDGPYDVEAEIRETIDHEVEHHLHHLSGHDPMDEEERREALRELERTFGKRAVRKAQLAEIALELRSVGKFALVTTLVLGTLLAVLYGTGLLGN